MIIAYGIHSAMFKIKKDINDILNSENFLNDVIKRQALIGNTEKPDTHLIDEAMRLGAEIKSLDFD